MPTTGQICWQVHCWEQCDSDQNAIQLPSYTWLPGSYAAMDHAESFWQCGLTVNVGGLKRVQPPRHTFSGCNCHTSTVTAARAQHCQCWVPKQNTAEHNRLDEGHAGRSDAELAQQSWLKRLQQALPDAKHTSLAGCMQLVMLCCCWAIQQQSAASRQTFERLCKAS